MHVDCCHYMMSFYIAIVVCLLAIEVDSSPQHHHVSVTITKTHSNPGHENEHEHEQDHHSESAEEMLSSAVSSHSSTESAEATEENETNVTHDTAHSAELTKSAHAHANGYEASEHEAQSSEDTEESTAAHEDSLSHSSSLNESEVESAKTSSVSSSSTAAEEVGGDGNIDASIDATDGEYRLDDQAAAMHSISHTEELMFLSLMEVAHTVSELGLDGVFASIHIQVLCTYIDLLVRVTEQTESLWSMESQTYSMITKVLHELHEVTRVQYFGEDGDVVEETTIEGHASDLPIDDAHEDSSKSPKLQSFAQDGTSTTQVTVHLDAPTPAPTETHQPDKRHEEHHDEHHDEHSGEHNGEHQGSIGTRRFHGNPHFKVLVHPLFAHPSGIFVPR